MEKKWLNAALSPEERATLLMKEMTLNEKIAQLLGMPGFRLYKRTGDKIEITDELRKLYDEFPGASIGSWNRADWYSGRNWETGLTPELMPVWHNMLQDYAVNHTRLGIPLIMGGGIIHGIFALGGSCFPTGIGLASTWNRDLVVRCYDTLADEAVTVTAADGFSSSGPTQDLARDPRWSRIEETWGEDPFLSAEMTEAFCNGLLKRRREGKRGPTPAIRHFLAYGETEGGHNCSPAHCGTNELYNIALRPFEAGFKHGATNVMTSYNLVDGYPCTISPIIEEVVRGKWHWEGTVIADAYAICNLMYHGFAEDLGEAAALALKSGTDCCCWEGAEFKQGLLLAFEHGQLTEAELDKHVRRILEKKFKSGIFEHPFIEDMEACKKTFRCKRSHDTALDAARESIVLVSNQNNSLPLGKVKKLAVVGPNADNMNAQIGDYSAPQRPGDVITVKAALETMAKENGMTVSYAKGCGIRSQKKEGFADALALVDEADAVIVVLGGSSIPNMDLIQSETGASIAEQVSKNTEQDKDCGEGYERANLHPGGVQLDFLAAIREKAHAQGKKVITVLIMGRPLILRDICELSDAVLLAWYPGMEGGTAIAETIFGKNNPSGRLPVSFPDAEGQIPVFYNPLRPRSNYIDQAGTPTYVFGTGLSYTKFEISDVHVEKAESAPGEENHVLATVKNTGTLPGKDVVQMYISDIKFSVARPFIELKGFEKVELKPGESRTVRFALTEKELGFYNRDLEYVVEPGLFKIRISDNGPDNGLETEFRIK